MADGNRAMTCSWVGASGRSYKYRVYTLGTNFIAKPGNYVFAKTNAAGNWVPIYIGESGDLSERFDNHHAMPCIRRNGATHVHVHASSSNRQERLNEETDLRRNYNPPCNKQ